MKKITLFMLLGCLAQAAFSQGEAHFTQFISTKQYVNPAAVSQSDVMNLNALYRNQWTNIPGAPKTLFATFSTPLGGNKGGIGATIYADKAGLLSTTSVGLDYAYNIRMGGQNRLSIGLKGEIEHGNIDLTDATPSDANDMGIMGQDPSYFRPNVGFGVTYSSNGFYVGASIPRLLRNTAYRQDQPTNTTYKNQRAGFGQVGLDVKLSTALRLQPEVLISYIPNAPLDVNALIGLRFQNKFYFGAGYRLEDAVLAVFQANIGKQLRIGVGYDFTTSELQSATGNSFELMLGYRFNYEKAMIEDLRFF